MESDDAFAVKSPRSAAAQRDTLTGFPSNARVATVPTPVGAFWIGCCRRGRLVAGWDALLQPPPDLAAPPDAIVQAAAARLSGPSGARSRIDLPDGMLPEVTPFEEACRNAALAIPPGTTLTYGAVARRIGRPGAARAVGQAMRRNPLPLFVPCHRVVAASGLGGYAGESRRGEPGLAIKRFLLGLERSPQGDRGDAATIGEASAESP